jgi:hypothetical protein
MAAPSEAELRVELDRLGPNARERIEAVQNFLTAQGAADLNASLVTAKQIEGVERLMANTRTQQRAAPAAASAPAHPAPASGPQRVDEPTFQRMSHAERIDYARQHDQRQFQNNR